MENGDRDEGLLSYFHVVWKHKWLVAIFCGLVLACTMVITKRQQKIYEAVAHMVIDPHAPQYLPGRPGSEVISLGTGNYWNTREYFETQYRILRSRMVAAMVVERMGLDRDLDFLGINKIDEPERRARVLERIDPAIVLQGKVKIEPVDSSHIVLIRVKDHDPARAAKIADTLVEAYAEANLDRKISGARDAVIWLTRQAKLLEDEVASSEQEILEFKKSRGIITASLADKQNLVGQNLQEASRELREAHGETVRVGSVLNQVKSLSLDEAQSIMAGALDNGLIQRLKEQMVGLENERTELLKRYLEGHPDVKAVDRKIKRVKKTLRREVKGVRALLEKNLAAAQQTERSLQRQLDGIKGEAQQLAEYERAYRQLEARVATKKELHAQMLARLKEAELQAEAKANNVRMLDPAVVPTIPVAPRLVLNMAVALMLSLFGGVGLAFLVDRLDASVKSQEQLEQEMGITALGMIPSLANLKKLKGRSDAPLNPDRYVLDHPRSTAAECARAVRTNIMFMAPENEMRTLLITSAGPREGKTSSSVNLAATMALSGSKILLVDSDLRRPRVHKIFDMSHENGLTNLVMDPTLPVEDVAEETGVENFHVLTSGTIPPNPAELLHTQAFRRTLDRLLEKYDRVIFDSPPVAAVTDAQILANQCDGAILVVRAGETSREMVKKAHRLLKDVGANVLGALLNGLDVNRRGYGQKRYGYYRYYGTYVSDEPGTEEGTQAGA